MSSSETSCGRLPHDAPIDEGPAISADVWIQVLAIFTFISGLFCVNFFLDSIKVQVTDSQVRKGLESPAQVDAAKTWIVDQNAGLEANAQTIAAAIAKARAGDVISLRAGVYHESVTLSKSVTLTGSGASADEVMITSSGPQTIAISEGRSTLNHLTIANTGGKDSEAVRIDGGALTVMNSQIRSSGPGVHVAGGELEAGDSVIESNVGVLIDRKAKARIVRGKISGIQTAVSISGFGTDLKVEGTELRADRGAALDADRFAKAQIQDATITGSNGQAAIVARGGAELSMVHSLVAENRGCGIAIDQAIVSLERDRFDRDRCGLAFYGPGSLKVQDSAFSEMSAGALRIKPGLEDKAVVKGSGNVGLEIPKNRERP